MKRCTSHGVKWLLSRRRKAITSAREEYKSGPAGAVVLIAIGLAAASLASCGFAREQVVGGCRRKMRAAGGMCCVCGVCGSLNGLTTNMIVRFERP